MIRHFNQIFLSFFTFLTAFAHAADPNVSVYIANPSYLNSHVYEFDIMIKASGSTAAFDLRTFQAGLYLNPSWVNGGTLTIENVATYTGMNTPGYNGAFSWNGTDKLINCSVNIGVRPTSTTCVSTSVTSVPVTVSRLRLTNNAEFSCTTPDIKFNYVSNISPLRLRTSFSWRESGCTTNYEMFYPGRIFTGSAKFNGETYSSTDADGRSPQATPADGFCFAQVTLTALLEGYYAGGTSMQPVLLNQLVSHANAEQTDSIYVDFHVTAPAPAVYSTTAILHTNGVAYGLFPSATIGKQGYLVIRHRNTIETWSSSEITMADRVNYNFTTANSMAYGDNMRQVGSAWALYTGDLNQDGFIDVGDFSTFDNDNLSLLEGYYSSDMNGDGFVDVGDNAILDNNNLNLIESLHP